MPQSLKQWTILGAGAVGHLLACRFAAQKIPALLIHREKDIKSNSMVSYQLNQSSKQFTLQYQSNSDVKSIQYLILAVKSHQVESAILSIKEALNSSSQLFLLQNGMGTLEKVVQLLKDIVPPNQIYPGTNTHGVYLEEKVPNQLEVIHAGVGELIFGDNYINHFSEQKLNQPDCLKTLKQLDLNTSWSATIERRLWMKIAINAAINPLTAIYSCKNGQLVNSDKMLFQVKLLCSETARLFKALSFAIDEATIINDVLDVIHKTANNQSSMLQDIQSGKKTEIESITGYLLEKAREHKIVLSTHENLYQQIKSQNLN